MTEKSSESDCDCECVTQCGFGQIYFKIGLFEKKGRKGTTASNLQICFFLIKWGFVTLSKNMQKIIFLIFFQHSLFEAAHIMTIQLSHVTRLYLKNAHKYEFKNKMVLIIMYCICYIILHLHQQSLCYNQCNYIGDFI